MACAAPAGPVTTSGRAVLLDGDARTTAVLVTPDCDGGEFWVQQIHVGPEVQIDDARVTSALLPDWAASVPVYPRAPEGAAPRVVPFTVAGRGAQHLSGELAGGQPLQEADRPTFPVSLSVLGPAPARARFEFNVHVSGVCRAR